MPFLTVKPDTIFSHRSGTIPILLRYMKLKEDLAGQYYDQVRPIMTADGTVSVELQKKYLDQALKVLAPKWNPLRWSGSIIIL